MRRGDVYWVDLEPSIGSEADKVRPAVIVSGNGLNNAVKVRGRGVLTIVPLTRNVTKIYPFQALIPASDSGLPRDSKVQAEQIRSIAPERLRERVGKLSPATLAQVDRALRTHLAL